MGSEPAKICRWPKWALFVAFLMTVPVPYYMIVVGGMVPLFFILFLAVQGLIVALPKFTAEGFWMLGILWTHVVVLGTLLYIGASIIHWLLFRVLPRRLAKIMLFAFIATLVALSSLFPIYRLPGHNYAPPANIFRFLPMFATEHRGESDGGPAEGHETPQCAPGGRCTPIVRRYVTLR